jgi:acetyl esterase
MALHPQAAAYLDSISSAPPINTLTPTQARHMGRGYLRLQRTPVAVHAIDHHYVVGPTASLPVRIYRPVEPSQASPCVLMLHGGGFVIGDIETSDEPARLLARDTGLTVIAVNYQKAPEHPYPTTGDDCWATLQWIIENAEDLAVDPHQVGIVGDSAGGNLAAALAMRARENELRLGALALIYPALTRRNTAPSRSIPRHQVSLRTEDMDWFWKHYLGGQVAGADAEPLDAPDLRGFPPTYIATAEYDVLRDDGVAMGERLRAAGCHVHHVDYAGMIHGFYWMDGILDDARTLQQDLATWLGAQLRA